MTNARPVPGSLFPELVGEWATGPILGSVFVGTNADLIAAVAPLYLQGNVLDCTYGKGAWWKSDLFQLQKDGLGECARVTRGGGVRPREVH